MKPVARPAPRAGAPVPAAKGAPKAAPRAVPRAASRPPGKAASEEEAAEVLEPKARNARLAAAGVLLAVAALEFATAVVMRDPLPAAVWVLLGVVSVALGALLFKGRFSAWGSAMIANALAVLLSLFGLGTALGIALVAVLIASYVVLYLFRLPFGVGAWKIEAAAEDASSRALVGTRTKNPSGVRCPKCGADRMWIADDGSAFCLACRAGTIELAGREPS